MNFPFGLVRSSRMNTIHLPYWCIFRRLCPCPVQVQCTARALRYTSLSGIEASLPEGVLRVTRPESVIVVPRCTRRGVTLSVIRHGFAFPDVSGVLGLAVILALDAPVVLPGPLDAGVMVALLVGWLLVALVVSLVWFVIAGVGCERVVVVPSLSLTVFWYTM